MTLPVPLAASLFAVALLGCQKPVHPGVSARNSAPAAKPKTHSARLHDFPIDELVAPGKIEVNPNRLSKVLLSVPGRVRRVLVRLGDSVAEGQPLVVIESAEAGIAMTEYSQSQAHLRQAATSLARLEKELARAIELHSNKAAPLKDVVNAEAEVELARDSLALARSGAEESLHRLRILGLDPAHHTHDVSVLAPISGKILDLSVAPGEVRNDLNLPLMSIADLSTVWVYSDVGENAIRLIRMNEPVVIELLAYPGEIFRGRVRRIGDTVDPNTRTVKVQAELDNPAGRLRPEMFARIRHSHGVRRLVAVPAAAVVHGGGAAWVMVERQPDRFVRTRVETGEPADGQVPILNGLRPGNRVLVDGAALARER